jgi:hypothetical protein
LEKKTGFELKSAHMLCAWGARLYERSKEPSPQDPDAPAPGGAEAEDSLDDEDYEYSADCYVAMPKDSVEGIRYTRDTATTSVQCCGTIIRSHRFFRDPETERSPHIVAVGAETVAKEEDIESLLPMSCERYWRTAWTKCTDCNGLDEQFREDAERKSAHEFQIAKHERAKRKREVKHKDAQNKLSKLTAAAAAPSECAMPEAVSALSSAAATFEKMKQPQLKELCRLNHLMTSGTKKELVLKLVRCKLHGGPGACPKCFHNKLEFTYPIDDITALPTHVECKHYKGPGRPCVNGTKRNVDHATYRFVPMIEDLSVSGGGGGGDGVAETAATTAAVSASDASVRGENGEGGGGVGGGGCEVRTQGSVPPKTTKKISANAEANARKKAALAKIPVSM